MFIYITFFTYSSPKATLLKPSVEAESVEEGCQSAGCRHRPEKVPNFTKTGQNLNKCLHSLPNRKKEKFMPSYKSEHLCKKMHSFEILHVGMKFHARL
jgi:hypothetical protein